MSPERLRVVTGLAGDGGWRADLALDRSTTPPRAVLLARVPPAMASDALALAALARGIDLAARITHPAVRRVLGVAEASGDMVVLEGWREGETLEWLLRTGGPLSPPLAARIAVELAAALHAAHTLAAAGGTPLAHGDLRAERVLVTEDEAVLLCGLGRPTAEPGSPAADLHALARLLAECLPPGGEGTPAALAAVIERGLSAEGFASARALGEAVEAAIPPAPIGALAARLEAVLPPGQPGWQARRSALAQAFQSESEGPAEPTAPLDAQPAPPRSPPPSAIRPKELSPPPGSTPPAMPVPAAVAPPVSSSPTRPDSIMAQPVAPATAATASVSLTRLVEAEAKAAEGDGSPAYVDVASLAPAVTRPTSAARPSWESLLADPRAPTAVGAAAAVVGLLLGLLLGGR